MCCKCGQKKKKRKKKEKESIFWVLTILEGSPGTWHLFLKLSSKRSPGCSLCCGSHGQARPRVGREEMQTQVQAAQEGLEGPRASCLPADPSRLPTWTISHLAVAAVQASSSLPGETGEQPCLEVFSSLALWTVGTGSSLLWCRPVCCGSLISFPGLYSLDSHSTFSRFLRRVKRNVLRCCCVSPGVGVLGAVDSGCWAHSCPGE